MSNADKRTVSTDALETLGTVIDDTQKRDAIHLAVEPVVAGEQLWPGQDVLLVDGVAIHRDPSIQRTVGIVDPFLRGPVYQGQRFWLVVYPRQIKSLRHVWSHPDFPEEPVAEGARYPAPPPPAPANDAKSEAERWLRAHAELLGLSFWKLLEHADSWLHYEEYYVENGSEHMRDTFDAEGFWTNWSAYTGKSVPDGKNESFFSCSC